MGERWVLMEVEGIRACPCAGRPVLALREVTGPRGLAVRIHQGEARILTREFAGQPTRHSLTYAFIEDILARLGGRIAGIRLLETREQGLLAEVELASDRARAQVAACLGDAAALAWRLRAPIAVPAEIVLDAPLEELLPWDPEEDPAQVAEFRRFLDRVTPEDFRE